MDMKHVVGGAIVTAALAMWVAPAAAQQGATDGYSGREIEVKKLGGTTRFATPMRGVDDLHSMANTNRDQITRVLNMAGLANATTQILDAMTTGVMSDTTIAPGTHLQWMALKRSGRPDILRNVRWSGRASFDAWQFSVDSGGSKYQFVVPRIGGNF